MRKGSYNLFVAADYGRTSLIYFMLWQCNLG